jgi:hypothetical protein
MAFARSPPDAEVAVGPPRRSLQYYRIRNQDRQPGEFASIVRNCFALCSHRRRHCGLRRNGARRRHLVFRRRPLLSWLWGGYNRFGQVAGGNDLGHAVLWTGPGTSVDLHPVNLYGHPFSSSGISDIYGGQQVGAARNEFEGAHAFLWNGSADSAVDLTSPQHIFWMYGGAALATDGIHQVGYGYGGGLRHAVLWSGTAASSVDLHPGGFSESFALGVRSGQQIGYGIIGDFDDAPHHALLWKGTADSAVDLHPTNLDGFIHSFALATNGIQQVGVGSQDPSGAGDFSRANHALLWNGTADSAVDLHPTKLSDVYASVAVDTNGAQQVGYGFLGAGGPNPTDHALLWSGTADSAIDLHAFLPADFAWSHAESIDPLGNVFGMAIDATGVFHAVEWMPVPEPASAILLMLALGTVTGVSLHYDSDCTILAP